MLEQACHGLDEKGVLQGHADGGRTYEEYQRASRRDLELKDEIRSIQSAIRVLQQLITLFTITATTSLNPSHASNLAHLQSAMIDKGKELDKMVNKNINNPLMTGGLHCLGNRETRASEGYQEILQTAGWAFCESPG